MYKSPLLCNKFFKNLDSELRAKKVEVSNAQPYVHVHVLSNKAASFRD